LLDTGDGVGAGLVDGEVLALVLAPVELLALELVLALAEVDAAAVKLPPGSGHLVAVAEADGEALADADGEVLAEADGEELADAEGEALAEAEADADDEALALADGHRNAKPDANAAGLEKSDCRLLGSRPLGNRLVKAVGSTKPGNGPGLAVGEFVVVDVADGDTVAACAGHVSASSRNCTCGWLSSVITVAAAWVSWAPGKVAT